MKKPRYIIETLPVSEVAARLEQLEDDGYVDWEWDFMPHDTEAPSFGTPDPRCYLTAKLKAPKAPRAPRKPKANIPIEDKADA